MPHPWPPPISAPSCAMMKSTGDIFGGMSPPGRAMMEMCAAQWGSQSWLQPAFSRPSAEHEGSLTTHEPPERRLRARLPAPRLFSRKSLVTPAASRPSFRSDGQARRPARRPILLLLGGPLDGRHAAVGHLAGKLDLARGDLALVVQLDLPIADLDRKSTRLN